MRILFVHSAQGTHLAEIGGKNKDGGGLVAAMDESKDEGGGVRAFPPFPQKKRKGWGTEFWWWLGGKDKNGWRFVAAHPSGKNKDAARVGHPIVVGGNKP
jgi:hypothetical protein